MPNSTTPKSSPLSKSPYKGCRDLFPADKRIQEYLFTAFAQTAKRFGFEAYDGPLLEPVELYLAKSGQELINEQIYSFKDRGERLVAIRPEMTPTVARMVAQIHREAPRPLRWYSIPNLMRYERPQKGRLREHWQFNCDIFGLESPQAEWEIFSLIVELFQGLGATQKHFAIHLNSRELVDELCEKKLKLSGENAYQFYKLIDRSKKMKPEEFQTELQSFAQEAQPILTDYLELKSFTEVEAFLQKYDLSCPGFSTFLTSSKESAFANLTPFLAYDPTIVRGLDYYTGIVFEVFNLHPEHQRALCGGGAYDNLLQIFNEPALGGIGFGLGDVTLRDFLDCHHLLPDLSKPRTDVLVVSLNEVQSSRVWEVAKELRAQGINCECLYGAQKTKKVFQYSEHKGHPWIILLGDSNAPEGLVLKCTDDRTSKTIELTQGWIQKVSERIKMGTKL